MVIWMWKMSGHVLRCVSAGSTSKTTTVVTAQHASDSKISESEGSKATAAQQEQEVASTGTRGRRYKGGGSCC